MTPAATGAVPAPPFSWHILFSRRRSLPVYPKWTRALNGLRARAREPQKNGQHDNDGFPAHCRQPVLPAIPWIRHRRQPSDVLTDLSGNIARSARVSWRAVWRKNMDPLPYTTTSSRSEGGCPARPYGGRHGRAGDGAVMGGRGSGAWEERAEDGCMWPCNCDLTRK